MNQQNFCTDPGDTYGTDQINGSYVAECQYQKYQQYINSQQQETNCQLAVEPSSSPIQQRSLKKPVEEQDSNSNRHKLILDANVGKIGLSFAEPQLALNQAPEYVKGSFEELLKNSEKFRNSEKSRFDYDDEFKQYCCVLHLWLKSLERLKRREVSPLIRKQLNWTATRPHEKTIEIKWLKNHLNLKGTKKSENFLLLAMKAYKNQPRDTMKRKFVDSRAMLDAEQTKRRKSAVNNSSVADSGISVPSHNDVIEIFPALSCSNKSSCGKQNDNPMKNLQPRTNPSKNISHRTDAARDSSVLNDRVLHEVPFSARMKSSFNPDSRNICSIKKNLVCTTRDGLQNVMDEISRYSASNVDDPYLIYPHLQKAGILSLDEVDIFENCKIGTQKIVTTFRFLKVKGEKVFITLQQICYNHGLVDLCYTIQKTLKEAKRGDLIIPDYFFSKNVNVSIKSDLERQQELQERLLKDQIAAMSEFRKVMFETRIWLRFGAESLQSIPLDIPPGYPIESRNEFVDKFCPKD